MDQARSTISKIFNGEPHSYTRFNLTRNMEGDNSQVEMKLSSEMDEETGGNGVGEHLNHNSNCKPNVAHKLGRTPKNLCFLAAATLLIFIIGYLIGFLVHRKKDVAPVAPAFPTEEKQYNPPPETGAAPLMDWDDVKKLLAEKVSAAKFESVFNEFSSTDHRAGSKGDEDLGNKIINKFKEYNMKAWTDEHFVKVQDAPTKSNSYTFRNQTAPLEGFLSYSATGTRKGALLYANYGHENDFKALQQQSINMNGRVMLVKTGRISLAEKVANAAKMNASAVLIYPDPDIFSMAESTPLFGHVHLGSGDPYTPGFPSFNHTQFPPIQSSGLPKILAQTISAQQADSILNSLGGQSLPDGWSGFHKLGGDSDIISVEVNNPLTEKKITNVFGVIKGFVDPDRYVVIGAQRDAWGPGFAASTVGTSVLMELARSISDMVENERFTPRRSIVFASWSAGEYGNVGATEWLEGYLSSLSMKAFAYINLDAVVTGQGRFKASASPLLYSLIQSTMREVTYPNSKATLLSQFGGVNWEANVLQTMKMNDAAYPFIAFSGIPSVSFRFSSDDSKPYPYFGTKLDTREKLSAATGSQASQLAELASRFAGHMVLRLVHDHLLRFDLKKYSKIIQSHVAQINLRVFAIKRMKTQKLPTSLTVRWLMSASGSYSRAADGLLTDIQNSNLDDIEMCRLINDRIMAVERNFLSPYVSPREQPFRHILLGSGPHTLKGLSNHLEALTANNPDADADEFRNQFALATWTIQGCANSLAGDIWSLNNQI